MSWFPEDRLPVVNFEDYQQRILKGYEIAQQSSVVILSIARDCATKLRQILGQIELIEALFQQSKVYIYENDSRDVTPAILTVWAYSGGNRVIISETLGTPKFDSVRTPTRTILLAQYRNRVKDAVIEHPTYYIVFDADLHLISIDGILHSLSFDYDGVFSNGLYIYRGVVYQYDTWAWRQHGREVEDEKQISLFVPSRGDPVIPVYSAFGGLGIYKGTAYESGTYKGGEDIEHLFLHESMRAAGFDKFCVNPSMVVLYNNIWKG